MQLQRSSKPQTSCTNDAPRHLRVDRIKRSGGETTSLLHCRAVNSFSRGADVPLLDLTISQALARMAGRFGGRDALIVCHQNARLTWSEFDLAVTRTAAGLAALGLAPGDRAGIWAVNCVEWLLLQFGAARAGVVLVNVNPAYRSHELRFVLERSRIRALFLHERDTRTDYRAILEECGPPRARGLAWRDHRGTRCSRPAILPGRRRGAPDDVANIQYTSGTTGSPKGVLLTHRNILNNGLMIAHALQATEHDRICVPVPMYHCFGCVIGSMVSVATGAAMILPSAQFDARAALEAVERERATAIYGVPTMFIAELEHPEFDRFDLSSLRTGIMAGATCPIEVMRQGLQRHALPRTDHRVRADRVVAGDHHVAGGRFARNARDHDRRRAAQHRGEDRGPGDARHRAAGRDRGTLHARVPGDEGL